MARPTPSGSGAPAPGKGHRALSVRHLGARPLARLADAGADPPGWMRKRREVSDIVGRRSQHLRAAITRNPGA